MKKFYISMLAMGLSLGINAQNVTKGAVFSAGNQYNAAGNQVYFYGFDTEDLQSWVIDSIPGDFSNKVISDGHYAYVHVGRGTAHPLGGDRIFKYDVLDTNGIAMDSTDALVGFKNFEVIDDKLVITRAFPATSEFVKVYDKNDLTSVLYTDTDISFACNGIAIENNKAYIASSTPNDSGIVHVFDLSGSISYDGAYNLDTIAAGGQNIFIDNGNIYLTHARVSPSYSIMYAGVTTINMADSSYSSDTTGFVSGTVYSAATGFDFFNGKILANFGNPLETYDVSNGSRTNLFTVFPTDAKKDPNAEKYLVQTTDYFSFGQVDLYDNQGNVLHTVNTKVSGASIAMVTNNFPTAVNDTIYGGALHSGDVLWVEPLVNDFDLDGEKLTLDTLLNQPAGGEVVVIVGDSLKLTNAGQLVDTIYYVTSDEWGDTDTAFVSYNLIGSVNNLEVKYTSVFPNPTNAILNVKSDNGRIENIQIIDLTGRLVKNFIPVANQTEVNVTEFRSGVYFVQVTVNGNVEIHRLVIQ